MKPVERRKFLLERFLKQQKLVLLCDVKIRPKTKLALLLLRLIGKKVEIIKNILVRDGDDIHPTK